MQFVPSAIRVEVSETNTFCKPLGAEQHEHVPLSQRDGKKQNGHEHDDNHDRHKNGDGDESGAGHGLDHDSAADGGQERFQLVRKDGLPAMNLSAGERSAIAFSYFLSKLKEIKPEQFKETIVYIDDPISSLDANHIFQVTAAIRDFFFARELQNGKGMWTTRCRQIFISTHSFEFFHLLREVKPEPGNQCRLYLIRRIRPQASTLGNMPESLAKYASEYHFLFEVIYRFHKDTDKTDHEVLMLLPNAVRRFVELYTYSRLPGGFKETVDQRAEALFGPEKAKRILKVLHYFSHANTIDRMAGNNELIFDVENAVSDLLSFIETKDPPHWEALVEATNILRYQRNESKDKMRL